MNGSGMRVVLCAAMMLASGPPAQAAFPGRNGQIVFAGQTARYGFFVGPPTAQGIYVVDPDTGSQRPLRVATDGAAGSEGFSGPAWSADGSKIVYSHSKSGAGNTLEVMNQDGSEGRVLGESGWWPAWSPDGSMIVTTRDREPLMVVDGAGQNQRFLGVRGSAPVWSPDCSRIAFEGAPDGRIRTVTADGDVRTVTQGSSPNWSPDGKSIVFWRYNEEVDPTVYVVKADGSGERDLGWGIGPAWSPDGKRIAFIDILGGISVMNADGSDRRVVVAGGGTWNQDPDWQPLPLAAPQPGICDAWLTTREAATLRVSVTPTRARVGRLTRFRFRVSRLIDGETSPVRGALIRFAGRRARTGGRGRAAIERRFSRRGRYEVVATMRGLSPAAATVRVLGR